MDSRVLALVTTGFFAGTVLLAQVTPAEGYTPPNDDPSVKVGGTLFLDYTWTQEPQVRDADGNLVQGSAFNLGRAYVNVTGQIHHLLSFRVTPDVVRETGSGSSLSGSYTLRIKYAYVQLNLDDWMPRGSWVRFAVQPTPYIEFIEGIYRYRFQGPILADREGFLSSSDLGLSAHVNFPGNFGDVHVGVYNGEGYNRSEANDQKAFQARLSVRPFPQASVLRGLRLTGFYDSDHYVSEAAKQRALAAVTFEHPWIHAGFEYLDAKDQTTAATREVEGQGFSAWAVPRTPFGLEGLFRYDELEPDDANDSKKTRTVAGVAYWFTFPKPGVTTALLADYERVTNRRFAPARADEKRYALHMLVAF